MDQAGEFYSFTIALNNNDNFVEGASVTLHGQADGDVTLATDANGTATFPSVRSGGNIITISAAGFASVVLNVDFPPLEEGVNFEITPDWRYIPLPASTSAIVPLFSTDPTSGSTATVRGRVEIETDVTNLTPEVPQDIQVTALVNIFDAQLLAQGGISISRYAFDNDSGFGVAAVDNTTGEYSMMVPATDDGIEIELEVPNIDASQRIAVGWDDGVQLERPEYRDIMTSFGPEYSAETIYNVNGAVAVFPEPPAPGTGFGINNFQRVPAPLFNLSVDRRSTSNYTAPIDVPDAVVQFTSLGEGYTSSPTVTINDNTGSNARAEAHVEFAIGGVTVNTSGTGYSGNEQIDINFIVERLFDDGTTADIAFTSLVVTADGNGDIGQVEVTAAVDNAVSSGLAGFSATNPVHVVSTFLSVLPSSSGFAADEMAGMRVEFGMGSGTPPIATPTLSLGRLLSMTVTNQGEDYTLPSFSFSGGGATTQASLDILAYESQWVFDLDNSSSSGYVLPPEDIYFEYTEANTELVVSNTDGDTDDIEKYIDGVSVGGFDFITNQILVPNGSGGLAYSDEGATYRTNFSSASTPIARVIERETEQAHARIFISNAGSF